MPRGRRRDEPDLTPEEEVAMLRRELAKAPEELRKMILETLVSAAPDDARPFMAALCIENGFENPYKGVIPDFSGSPAALSSAAGTPHVQAASTNPDAPTLHLGLGLLETADPFLLHELRSDLKLRPFLGASVTDQALLVVAGKEDALQKQLLKSGHTPRVARQVTATEGQS